MNDATEARDLLLSCLRFQPRDTDGRPLDGPGVHYDQAVDDRDPIGFEFPASLPHSPGPNRVWNTIVTLPILDVTIEDLVEERNAAIEHLRNIVDAVDGDAERHALVAGVRWLAAYDHDCDEDQ